MPLDPQARRLLDMIALAPPAGRDVTARRAGLAKLARAGRGPVPAGVAARDISVAGADGDLPARIYTPDAALGDARSAGLLFFHGGGFVAGDIDAYDGLCRHLAEAAGCRIVSVAYRLAPEHPFPAAIEDGLAAARWSAGNAVSLGIDPARLAVAGASAGAGIAAYVCQHAASHRGPHFAAQLLLCPVLDAEGVEPARSAFADGYGLDAETMRRDVCALGLAALDATDPRLSPLRGASLSGLPPALIHTAQFDIVRDGGTAYAERLRAAGVPVALTCHAGMIHDFYLLPGLIPAARAALARIGAELRDTLGGPDETPPC